MDFAEAKAAQAILDADVARTGAALNAFPKDGPMGLTSEAVRATAEWKLAKYQFDFAFGAFQKFNIAFTKAFAKELREERRARRAA